uniref:EB domain-containing protein n=1 Tax=Rhabditophanes sp. KR3021 TaxID=114890 RepID=A0AC35TUR0_9BILA
MKFYLVSLVALSLAVTSIYGDSVDRVKRQIPGCNPGCIGGGVCSPQIGACACAQPAIAYSPVIGCAPVAPLVPVPVRRLIPQGLPGSECGPGVECTGGSFCSNLNICQCELGLSLQGTVCVLPPLIPVVPVVPVVQAVPIALGAPCAVNVPAPAPMCQPNAVCSEGLCRCAARFQPVGGACMMR